MPRTSPCHNPRGRAPHAAHSTRPRPPTLRGRTSQPPLATHQPGGRTIARQATPHHTAVRQEHGRGRSLSVSPHSPRTTTTHCATPHREAALTPPCHVPLLTRLIVQDRAPPARRATLHHAPHHHTSSRCVPTHRATPRRAPSSRRTSSRRAPRTTPHREAARHAPCHAPHRATLRGCVPPTSSHPTPRTAPSHVDRHATTHHHALHHPASRGRTSHPLAMHHTAPVERPHATARQATPRHCTSSHPTPLHVKPSHATHRHTHTVAPSSRHTHAPHHRTSAVVHHDHHALRHSASRGPHITPPLPRTVPRHVKRRTPPPTSATLCHAPRHRTLSRRTPRTTTHCATPHQEATHHAHRHTVARRATGRQVAAVAAVAVQFELEFKLIHVIVCSLIKYT